MRAQDNVAEQHERYEELVKMTYVARMNEVAWPGALDNALVNEVFSSPATTFLVYRGLLAWPGWRQIHVRTCCSPTRASYRVREEGRVRSRQGTFPAARSTSPPS